jgi:plastocyanin
MGSHVLVKSTVAKAYAIIMVLFVVCSVFTISCQRTAPHAGNPGLPSELTPGTPSTALPANQVVIEGFAFKPDTLNILAGTTVTWRNNDSAIHTVTAGDNSFTSGSLSSGATFSYTFTKTGTFEYHCQIHPSMAGKVIVK